MDAQETDYRFKSLTERARRWRVMAEARETCARLGREEIERRFGPAAADEVEACLESRPNRFRKLLARSMKW
jgi:hypothetical protein